MPTAGLIFAGGSAISSSQEKAICQPSGVSEIVAFLIDPLTGRVRRNRAHPI
jgi:hypothetical protein